LEFLYWFFVGPALLLALLSLRGERKRAAFVAERLAAPADNLPPASVIVPVKGADEGLRENLGALAALDYPDYELIVTAQCAADIPPGVLPARVKVVLAHGGDARSSEKIRNLVAAVRATRRRSDIFAFADSDTRVTPRWLRALAAPLANVSVGASTGYRWFLPTPPTFWTLMRSVWDAVCFGMLGPGDAPFVWGGSMAIRKETFFEIGVPEHWKNTVSDDYALTTALKSAHLKIAFAPGALAPSFDRTTFRGFLEWSRRQMILTRVYRPRLWWTGLLAHIFYCGGMAASIAASIAGHRLAEWALIAQVSPGMLKALNRATLARAALPEHEAWFRRHTWVHAIWSPLATWLWLLALVSAAFQSHIVWRGQRYNLRANETVTPPRK
jgi:cellulose synthase/poly-beta-1,6-N-acetylglucosamine synthase-like glycosyltransferase